MTDGELTPTPDRRASVRRALAVGVVAALAIIAVPVLANLGNHGSKPADKHATDTDADNDTVALATVRAAVGNTVAAGSFETETTTHATHPTAYPPGFCERAANLPTASGAGGSGSSGSAACGSTSGPTGTSVLDARGVGTVNFNPYVSRMRLSQPSAITLWVTPTTVWLLSGSGSGPGTPLADFAHTVQGAMGPSQGALAMIGMASPGGELNLAQAAVADATPAGTGVVDDVDVTYYDVTIDMSKLAEEPGLSDAQHATIEAALPLLAQGGYEGTTEHIGIDELGYIREITATNHFTDGSTGVRHTILRNFGCAERIAPPGQPAPTPVDPSCTSPVPATTTPPMTTTPAPASTTASSLPSPTSAPATTAPPTSTSLGPPPPPSSTTTTKP
jgi:cell division septation protein DedD